MDLSKLGQKLRAAQDASSDETHDLNIARYRILNDSPERHRGKFFFGKATFAFAAFSFAAALSIFLMMPSSASLQFQVNGAQSSVDQWITSTDEQGSPLTFTDGSTILLQQGAQARVTQLSKNGAHLELSDGRAVVSVIHQDSTDFQLKVGPYLVEVTGTRFITGWQQESQKFFLEMLDGSVRVSGPQLPGRVGFITGQKIEVSALADSTAPANAVSAAAEAATHADTQAVDAEISVTASKNTANLSSKTTTTEDGPHNGTTISSWQDLAKLGEHASAISTAEQLGIEKLLNTASASDLFLLADSATYSGRSVFARQILGKIRERWSGSNHASQAAFALGRLSDKSAGIRWFEIYLNESPSGPLAREALGRVLEAEAESGNMARATAVAKRYLARFPNGPHAKLATKINSAAE